MYVLIATFIRCAKMFLLTIKKFKCFSFVWVCDEEVSEITGYFPPFEAL